MTWLVALGYGLSFAALLAGALVGRDPRVAGRIRQLAGSALPRPPALERLARFRPVARLTARLEARMAGLGLPAGHAHRYAGLKVGGGLAGVLLGTSVWGSSPLVAAVSSTVLGVAAFHLPDFFLARRAAHARARIASEVPDLLDVAAVCVTAGLTPQLALERAVGAVEGPLAEVLERMRSEVAMGLPWRRALRQAAEELGQRDLLRLATVLDRGRRLGVPVAAQVRRLASDVRSERRATEEERARRAPVSMLFPLVFLILPAFVLAAVVPAIVVATRAIP